jgi:ABC-2 type transport system ATP-binding protein/lipopolysaccharide transport system ATP-binding protein
LANCQAAARDDVGFTAKARHRIDNFVAKASILVLASTAPRPAVSSATRRSGWMRHYQSGRPLDEILEMYAETLRDCVELA